MSADDCKPNKALRLTIKAFLKSEEKKRDKSKGSNSTENALQQNEASSKAGSAQNASSIKVETVTTKNIPAESVVADLKNMESRDTTVVQQFQKVYYKPYTVIKVILMLPPDYGRRASK